MAQQVGWKVPLYMMLSWVGMGSIPRAGNAQPVLTIPSTLEERCIGSEDAQSCYELGLLYYRSSVLENRIKGAEWIRKGCQFEMSVPCSEDRAVARAKETESVRLKLDSHVDERQREVLQGEMSEDEIACWDGKPEACDKAGIHYQFLASPTDPKKAVALYTEGCRLGNQGCCNSLSLIEKGIVHVFKVEM